MANGKGLDDEQGEGGLGCGVSQHGSFPVVLNCRIHHGAPSALGDGRCQLFVWEWEAVLGSQLEGHDEPGPRAVILDRQLANSDAVQESVSCHDSVFCSPAGGSVREVWPRLGGRPEEDT